jgi:hypothetical protein
METRIPDRKILRRMKYLSDQQGIMNRYLAEGEGWEPHLERTRDFIRRCVGDGHFKSIAVLGSGWLLDLPLDFLSQRSEEVLLLDIWHPPQVKKKITGYGNVKAVEADITGGGIRGAYRFARDYRRTGKGSILDIPFQAGMGGIKAGYIISLNILNQLDILLVDYLKKHVQIATEEELEFRRRIQSQHLSLLGPGRSCMITDAEERVINREGLQASSKTLVHCEFPKGVRTETWTWDFDARGEYNPRMKTEMFVRAIQL